MAFIHDVEWSESENAPNAESNARFRRNGVKVACAAFGWWSPRRYKVMWDAAKFARVCQRLGWAAWMAPFEERDRDARRMSAAAILSNAAKEVKP